MPHLDILKQATVSARLSLTKALKLAYMIEGEKELASNRRPSLANTSKCREKACSLVSLVPGHMPVSSAVYTEYPFLPPRNLCWGLLSCPHQLESPISHKHVTHDQYYTHN